MLHRLIHSLRTKPKATRDHIALGTAGAFTAVFLVIWLVASPGVSVDSEELAASTGAFSTLISRIKEQVGTMQNAIPDDETISELTASLETELVVPPVTSTSSASSTSGVGELTSTTSTTLNNPSEKRVVQLATTSATSSETSED